jgi:putative hemolysin
LLVQIGAATIVGALAQRWFGALGVTVASVVLTILLFVYAEAIPKTYAVVHSDSVALRLSGLIAGIEILLRPIVGVLVWFADLQMPGKGITTSPTVTEAELRLLAGHAVSEGAITDHDRRLIDRAFRFGDRHCDDVMVPRPEIVAVEAAGSVSAALEVALRHGHRRLPVYEGSLDHIIGMVQIRDLMSAVNDRPQLAVRLLAEPTLAVPETKRIVSLLSEMQAAGRHLAIVVDEYGGTAGLVTVEDIAEELLGSISEDASASPVVEVGPGHWSVDGLAPVEDLDEVLRIDLPEGDWNTVAGLVMGLLGRMPRVGDEVTVDGVVLRVRSTRGRRISRVDVLIDR